VALRPRALAALLAAIPAAAALFAIASPAAAQPPRAASVILLPTRVAGGEDLATVAASLDALLADTARDLGLTVAGAATGPAASDDAALLERARAAHAIVLLPSLRAAPGGDLELRLELAAPGAGAVEKSLARISRTDLEVRAVVLFRDLVRAPAPAPAPPPPPAGPARAPGSTLAGRATLMANATAFGGLFGFSIERGSGGTDPRLLVPLTLVGAGIGLGASYLASGEWEVRSGDAWYFAAGAWWPTLAGHLIFQGRFADLRADSDRWVFGLLGGGVGATIATLGLALHPMSDGDAALANSGGGLGLALGALVEVAATGDARQVPFSGMGYGAGLGWLAAAALAVHIHPAPLHVAAVDAGAALGGLAGAAIGSPLLLGNASADRQRAWAAVTAGSALAGGVVAGVVARPRLGAVGGRAAGQPIFGVLGESSVGARSAPILGVGYSGPFPL